jgi:uncharacterized protein involved in outer membrane biogenesis
MKMAGRILLILAVVIAGLILARNAIIKSVTTQAIAKATGFRMELKSINVGLLSQTFEIEGLKLRNPPDFPDPDALDIDRILVHYDLRSFLAPTVHVHAIVIEIPQVVMVRNMEGETNLERMKDAASGAVQPESEPSGGAPSGEPPPERSPEPRREPAPAPAEAKAPKPFMIDVLRVKIGKVEIRDYARGSDGKPKVKTYAIAVDRTFQRVGSVEAIVNQLANQVLIEGTMKAVAEGLKKADESGDLQEKLNKAASRLGSFLK